MDGDFAPDASVRQAAAGVLRRLVGSLKANLDGVARDLGPDFLHDLRVATRRARAAAGQLKDALPQGAAQALQDELGALGEATNAVRDLDVFLLCRDSYRELLPDKLKPGWRIFADALAVQRAVEFEKLGRYLRSEDFAASLRRVDTLLRTLDEGDSPPAASAARDLLLARFKKTLRRGQAIDAESSDAELHRLRIDCKKLRYLLELFRPLFPAKQIDDLLKRLRALQDNLGGHHDLSVQIACLERCLGELDASGQDAMRVAAALKAMVAALGKRRASLRRGFRRVFAPFASDGNYELAKRLFKR